jgi:hypothetical protein
MKIELRYFTGTGNSLKVLNTCKKVLDKASEASAWQNVLCRTSKKINSI